MAGRGVLLPGPRLVEALSSSTRSFQDTRALTSGWCADEDHGGTHVDGVRGQA